MNQQASYQPKPLDDQSSHNLPPGWVAATDPVSSRIYYANPTTGETQWTPPVAPPPPMMPPPPPPQLPPVPQPTFQVPPQQPQYQQQHHHQMPPTAAASHHQLPVVQQQQPMMTQPHHQHQQPSMQQQPPIQRQQPIQQPVMQVQQPPHLLSSPPNLQQPPLPPTTAPMMIAGNFLVPKVQAILTSNLVAANANKDVSVELQSSNNELSVGVLADLCHIQKTPVGGIGEEEEEGTSKEEEDEKDTYYQPLNPYQMRLTSKPPHIEAGRVDIRLSSMYNKLKQIR